MSPSASVCEGTMKTIANLVQCKDKVLTVNLMNTAEQTGVVDCGLYALAVATCLLHNQDPTSVVFNQEELRTHFCQSLEKGIAVPGQENEASEPNMQERTDLCVLLLPYA